MSTNAKLLERFREIDARLASREGLHVTAIADEWGVDYRTIHRLLESIRAQGLETKAVQRGKPHDPDMHYTQHYVGRHRLFSRNLAKKKQDG